MLLAMNEIKEAVRTKYNEIAEKNISCCGNETDIACISEGYDNIEGHDDAADLGLGCGLPTKASRLAEGQYVVDLGSGAGNDVFIARSIVGEHGKVVGVDMAESMVARARENNTRLGYSNVEFRLGEIEDIPLANNTADVVISNCVFNLVPDKQRAFAETRRILKQGGHFAISDIVTVGELPEDLRSAAELYVGCVAGAINKDQYLDTIRNAGFVDVEVTREREINLSDEILDKYLTADQKELLRNSGTGIYSVTVVAKKPVTNCC